MTINQAVATFKELDRNDVDSILARNNVGRLAFTSAGRVEIRPVHYVYSDDTLYGRTSPETSIAQSSELPAAVAFEVDEIESVFQWKSVIVRGELDVLSPGTDEWKAAAELLRRVVKGTFTKRDPVPHRTTIFRLRVSEATGRAAG
jgi:uncharacterized protein